MSDVAQLPSFPLIALLAKVSLVLACGLLLASIRGVGPALRHAMLFASVCGALALLPLSIAVPRWNVAVLPAPSAGAAPTGWPAASVAGAGQAPTGVADMRGASAPPGVASATAGPTPAGRDGAARMHSPGILALIAIWSVGTLASLARLLVGRRRLRAIAARAWAPDDAPWTRLLEEEKRLAGVSGHVRVLVSPAAATPLTWGTRRPVVLLPEDALDWTAERRRIVLRHELAHIARGDALAQSLAAIACAVYWFLPLALMAAKRLRTECEHACDDRVVALGTESGEYASHLLDVARAARAMSSPGLLSLAMARPSQLEARLRAVLDASRPRAMPTRRAQVVAISLPLALATVGSALHPVSRAMTHAGDGATPRERVTVRAAASSAPVAGPTIAPSVPADVGLLPRSAATGTLDVRDRDATGGPRGSSRSGGDAGGPGGNGTPQDDGRHADHVGQNVDILLRADPALPRGAPVRLALSESENLVVVGVDVHPLDLRAAIELVKQVRAAYGRDLPGGSVRMSAPPHRPWTMRPSDAEPYEHLLQALLNAPMEEINGRPSARHNRFFEHPVVEVAVSDSTLTRLMESAP